jgi:hypothetical protein
MTLSAPLNAQLVHAAKLWSIGQVGLGRSFTWQKPPGSDE